MLAIQKKSTPTIYNASQILPVNALITDTIKITQSLILLQVTVFYFSTI